MFGSDESGAIDLAGYFQLDQWRVSRLTMMSPLSVQQNRYIVARLYRTDASQFVDLRLEPLQQNLPRLLEEVSIALYALPTSAGDRYTSSPDSWSSPTPPTTPSEYPLTITFSLAPTAQVAVSCDAKEEILYQIPTIDEDPLTLLTIAQIASIPSTRLRGDFALDFAENFKNLPQWYPFIYHGDTGTTSETDDTIGRIHAAELSNINLELQWLSELRLKLAAELRSCLYNAEKTAMEVQAFNTRQCERLGDVGGPQVFIDFHDDLKVKQDAENMIHRLERPAYIRGLRQ